MDEGRKRVLLIAAAILAARKLCQLESTRPSSALYSIIADAVIFAERIMQKVDKEWPASFKTEHPPFGDRHSCFQSSLVTAARAFFSSSTHSARTGESLV